MPQVPQVPQVFQALLDPKVTPAVQASQVPLVLMVLQVPEDLLGLKVPLVLPVLRGTQVSLVLQALLVWLLRVLLDPRVLLVSPVSPVLMEKLAQLVLLVPLVLLVRLFLRRVWEWLRLWSSPPCLLSLHLWPPHTLLLAAPLSLTR